MPRISFTSDHLDILQDLLFCHIEDTQRELRECRYELEQWRRLETINRGEEDWYRERIEELEREEKEITALLQRVENALHEKKSSVPVSPAGTR